MPQQVELLDEALISELLAEPAAAKANPEAIRRYYEDLLVLIVIIEAYERSRVEDGNTTES
jgi:hypothetical protein